MQSLLFVGTELLRLKNNGKFRERTSEGIGHHSLVLLQHRRSRVLSDIEGFVERETDPYCLRNRTLGDLLFVHEQRRRRRLADTAALIFKSNPNDVIASRERSVGTDTVLVLGLV